MTLSLMHAEIALLAAGAVTLPVIIHLLLRQRPRPFVFPALALLRKRQVRTTRRLRLQHLILLALRAGLILMLGLALARPSLRSSLFSIDQKAPTDAIIVVDTSLSMTYKEKGKTRLEDATAQARVVIDQLPESSRVGVIDASAPTTAVPLEPVAAIARLGALTPQVAARPLNEAVSLAFRTLAKSTYDRREVYILTDFAAHAWDLAEGGRLAEQAGLADAEIFIYVLNVGATNPENISLAEPALSAQVVAKNSETRLIVNVRNTGPDADRAIELSLDGQPRDNKPARLPANQATEVTFSLAGLENGFHQGAISINAGDAMPFDDQRFFTLETRPPVKILAIADNPTDAVFFANALAPPELQRLQRARYVVEVIPTNRFASTDLIQFGVVALLNVGTLPSEGWVRLSNFVQGGGGLFIALGERIDAVSYQSAQAQSVLPGKLVEEVRRPDGVYLSVDRFNHPILSRFKEWGTDDLVNRPALRYFKVEPTGESATIASYSDGGAAILERSFGSSRRGRAVLLTTAAHSRPGADSWTELPLGWSFVALADQIAKYLAGEAEARFNFLAGQPVPLEIPGAGGLVAVTDPTGQVERLAIDPGERTATVPPTKSLGNFRVDANESAGSPLRAFSVNESVEESNLSPLDQEKLAELIGKERLAIARGPGDIERVVGEGRVGRELFPWLMLLVVTLIAVEGYFANRFYRRASVDGS